jgi:O-antigen/teichoic acid export membrane protein
MLKTAKISIKGEFNRNVLTLVTGTGLAQLIPLAVTPLLSRMYSPAQFGVFALFTAVLSSLSVVATGRYELAIALPRKDANAANIAAFSISVCIVVSMIALTTIWLLNDVISNFLDGKSTSAWLYFVPLALLLNGIYINLNYWSNRKKLYSILARRRVAQSGGTSATQLLLGILHVGPGGLIIGTITGQAIAAGLLATMVRRCSPSIWHEISSRKMWALAKRYKSCPKLLVPAHTLSALSIQLPVVFINTQFGLSTSGFFLLAERIVGMPLSLVSASIGDVFRQRMAECYLDGRNCRREFVSAFTKLLAVATPPFTVLIVFAPDLFALLFGERWRVSGEYAQLMCPMFYLRFISNPLSLVAIVAQKNFFEFVWQAALLGCLTLIAFLHNFLGLEVKDYIIGFVGVNVAFDIVNLAASYIFARSGDVKEKVGALS